MDKLQRQKTDLSGLNYGRMNFLYGGAKTFNKLFHDKSGSNIC